MRVHRYIAVTCLVLCLAACGKKSSSADDAGSGGEGGRGGGGGTLGAIGDAGAGGAAAGGASGAPAGGGGGGATILTVDAGAATTLAMGAPADIAIDATHVYWTDPKAKTVMKVPKAGGAAITLASSQDLGTGLAVDATNVYWTTTQGAVMKSPLEGGTPIAIASQQQRPNSVAVAGNSVYWANGGADFVGTASVMKASLATGEVATFAANLTRAGSLGTDGTFLFWTEIGEGSGQVQWMPLVGGTLNWVVVQLPEAVAVGAGNVYWGEYSLPTGVGRVVKRALAGGQEVTLVSSSHGFSTLVADGADLYVPDGRTILRIAVAGNEVVMMPTEGTPARLAVDEARIYFTTAEGAVMVMPKP